MIIKKNVNLKRYCTFKIGGRAKYFCVVKNSGDLKKTAKWIWEKKERVFVLGGGSNVLFLDGGFDGLVVKMGNDWFEKVDGDKIKCGAGVLLSKLVQYSIGKRLVGLEWAAGIPGTVGGAVRGNAGAFGGEIKNNVILVNAFDVDKFENNGQLDFRTIKREECEFDYRDSVFKRDSNLIVWECLISFDQGSRRELQRRAKEIVLSRKEKQPELLKNPSAGSVFKNPSVSKKIKAEFERDKEIKCRGKKVPAGWLVERCGLLGKKMGGAMVSEKQGNFIVNTGGATAKEVILLISLIKTKVRNQFGVQLQEEIQVVS